MARIAAMKVERVKEIQRLLSEYPVVGVVSIERIPASYMQKIRKDLKNKVHLKVCKNNLIEISLKNAEKEKKGISELINLMHGQSGLVFSRLNPFRMYKELEKTKMKSPPRGGEIAPEDIVVKAGDTPFRPGPILSELQKAGIPAGIESGRVVIKKEKVVVKKGEKIPREIAHILRKLEICPITIGLDLLGSYEDGTVYLPDVLAVDDEKMRNELMDAYRNALSLSIALAYPTKATAPMLIQKAYTNALALSLSACIPTHENIKYLLSKSHAQMLLLKKIIDGKGG